MIKFRNWISLLLAAAFLMLVHPVLAENISGKPQILWYGIDWAPSWILEGELKGQGYSDRTQKLFQDALVEFDHKNVWSSFPRSVRALERQANVCFAASFYNWTDSKTGKPRTDILWSAPTLLFYWHGVTMLKENADQYRREGGADISNLIKDARRRVGLLRGRTYGPTLDVLLKPHIEADHIVWSASDKHTAENQYRLLVRGRVDYLIDYSFMMRYAERVLGMRGRFAFVPIRNHPSSYGLGAIGCNNSEIGRKVIAKINAVMPEVRKTPEFVRANTDWFLVSGEEAEYWRLWETELMARSQ